MPSPKTKQLIPSILYILLTLSAPTLSAQSGLDSIDLGSSLSVYQAEKVYVAHDKPSYAPGETIWCKVYLVDGQRHQYFAGTPVVYVDWITPAGRSKVSYTLQLQDGYATLDIPTGDRDTTGVYTLRAYTQYQRNFGPETFFQKEIRLLDFRENAAERVSTQPSGLDIRFFPEGGHMVEGLASTVAFKAVDEDQKAVNVTGVLVNQQGEKIGDAISLHEGIGLIKLLPQRGERYFLRTSRAGVLHEFPVPAALPAGIVLKLSSRSTEEIRVSLATNFSQGLKGCTLVGHIRGEVFLSQVLTGESKMVFPIRKTDLPSGLVHFTIFDQAGRPVAERLCFSKNPEEQLEVLLEPDQEVYGTRQRVNLVGEGIPGGLSAQASISVYYEGGGLDLSRGLDIKNYLWLQSELRGKVNNIGQYFRENDVRSNTLLDLLLMTHGWRKFDWPEVLAGRALPIEFLPEEHLTVSGNVTKTERDKPVRAEVLFNVLDSDNFTSLAMTTEEDGRFSFTGFDFRDTVEIRLQANIFNNRRAAKREEGEFSKSGNSNVDIDIARHRPPEVILSNSYPSLIANPETLQRYAYEIANQRARSRDSSTAFSVDLDEIVVNTGRSPAEIREDKIKALYGKLDYNYFSRSSKILLEEPQWEGFKYQTVFDLIAQVVPSVIMDNTGGRTTLKRFYRVDRGQDQLSSSSGGMNPNSISASSAANLLAGADEGLVPIFLNGSLTPITYNYALQIDPERVAVVESWFPQGLMNPEDRRPFGVYLFLKDPNDVPQNTPGVLTFSHPGFYQARTFYGPDYATFTSEEADYRTTLLWAPEIRLTGKNAIKFYTGDRPGRYTVWLEGITEDGIPFTRKTSFSVRD